MPVVRSASARSAGRALEDVDTKYHDILRGNPAALFGDMGGDLRAEVIVFADPAERGLRGEGRDGLGEPGERVVADPCAGRPRRARVDADAPGAEVLGHVPGQHVQ